MRTTYNADNEDGSVPPRVRCIKSDVSLSRIQLSESLKADYLVSCFCLSLLFRSANVLDVYIRIMSNATPPLTQHTNRQPTHGGRSDDVSEAGLAALEDLERRSRLGFEIIQRGANVLLETRTDADTVR